MIGDDPAHILTRSLFLVFDSLGSCSMSLGLFGRLPVELLLVSSRDSVNNFFFNLQ